ncbi:MAG: hypothetical protein R2909_01540 [Gemmatimonadales bacterium]
MTSHRVSRTVLAALSVVAVAACGPTDNLEPSPERIAPSFAAAGGSGSTGDAIASVMDQVNLGLEMQGADYRVAMAEYITVADANEAGATIVARDLGNKQLTADFVPGDARRTWSGPPAAGSDDITYAIDQVDAATIGGGLSPAETNGAIQRAMGTWDAMACSDLPLQQTDDFGLDLGIVAFQNGLGGASPYIVADVMHAGFTDINFSGGTLGVTFTFIFTSDGQPTDVDGNGKADVAFREIYYDPSWVWQIGGNIDVESVAVHEAGHGLSQAHFGNIMVKNDGSVKASPRAVMNALYTGVQQGLLGTDNGGHCSNWANWPRH